MSSSARDRLGQARPEVRASLLKGLSESNLIAAAQATTGLTEGLDAELREALRDLIAALLSEAKLSDAGLFGVRRRLLRILTNRLRIERDLRLYPGISSVPIVRPLVIVGLPRTGTTLLHNLLAQDPALRAPALWELECPSPPPEAASRDGDPRIAITSAYLEELFRVSPALRELHPMASQSPDECGWLLLPSLRARRLAFDYDIRSYGQALTPSAMRAPYRLYRTLLQMLTWRCPPPRLVLKDPLHLWHLDTLLEALPDAGLIHTHRDPLRVLPSATRLCATIRRQSSDEVDVSQVAAYWARELRQGLDVAMGARVTHPGSFHDIHYRDLVHDPVAEVRRLYGRFELTWSDELDARMRRWLERSGHARRRPGEYEDLAHLGLSTTTVQASFADYRARFTVPDE